MVSESDPLALESRIQRMERRFRHWSAGAAGLALCLLGAVTFGMQTPNQDIQAHTIRASEIFARAVTVSAAKNKEAVISLRADDDRVGVHLSFPKSDSGSNDLDLDVSGDANLISMVSESTCHAWLGKFGDGGRLALADPRHNQVVLQTNEGTSSVQCFEEASGVVFLGVRPGAGIGVKARDMARVTELVLRDSLNRKAVVTPK